MPARDETAWQQNEDGSWSRNRGGGTETVYGAHPVEAVEDEDEDDEELGENPDPSSTYDATEGALAAAEEHGVDLASVTGTGADGRITKADVEAALKEGD